MLPFLPAAIAAGSSLISGIMSSNAQEQAREDALQRNRELDAARLRDEAFRAEQFAFQKDQDAYSRELNARNEATQREFAQSGIQWRVADALKSGIHPLAALGTGVTPYSGPSATIGNVSGISSPASVNIPSGGSMGSAVSAMGQDISRAMMATQTQTGRDAMFQQTVQDMQLQNMALRNDLLSSQIQRVKNGGIGPAMPAPELGGSTVAPQESKIEPRKRLVMDGQEVITDPRWSPTQAVADEYGDENPAVSWIYGPLKMWYDYRYNQQMQAIKGNTGKHASGMSGGGW